ncbi:MAG: tetratricopeptide repeat protein [Acidobacteriota bacterium]|nr:tetratricopeptide repeat protein [Acidobacteriota bacterium]
MNRTLALFAAPGMAAALLIASTACQHSRQPQSATPIATKEGAAPQAAPPDASGDAKRWIALGNRYFDTHQRNKAIEAYAKALELDPNNPAVLTDQGVMYSETTQYEKAIANFQKAHAIDPTHLPSLLNLGMLYAQYLKDYDKAIKTWKRVIEIAPTTVHAGKAHAYIERVNPMARPQ